VRQSSPFPVPSRNSVGSQQGGGTSGRTREAGRLQAGPVGSPAVAALRRFSRIGQQQEMTPVSTSSARTRVDAEVHGRHGGKYSRPARRSARETHSQDDQVGQRQNSAEPDLIPGSEQKGKEQASVRTPAGREPECSNAAQFTQSGKHRETEPACNARPRLGRRLGDPREHRTISSVCTPQGNDGSLLARSPSACAKP